MTETAQESLHFLDYLRVIRARKEIVIAVFLLVVATGIGVTYMLPKVYMASTVIAVKEESPDVEVFSRGGGRYDPLFLRTQFELIRAEPVIEEVVRKLNLAEKLGRANEYDHLPAERAFEQTVRLISRAIKVNPYKDTNLIEVEVYLSEPQQTAPQDAADVADMIATVFRAQNHERSRAATDRALKALYESLEEQRKRVAELEAQVETIRQKYQITLLGPAGNTGASLSKNALANLDTQRIRSRLELEDKKARFDLVSTLSADQLLDAAPYLVSDSLLATLVSQRRTTEIELSQSQAAGFGANHPTVVRLKAILAELGTKTEEALSGLRTGIKADYDAAKAKFDALETMVEQARATEIDAEAGGYREFERAHQELEHAKRVRDALEMRHIQERIELRIPRTTVEIIKPAKAPAAGNYVSPNLYLYILISVALGLVSGIGLAYFVEYLDTSLKTVEDVERSMGLQVVGVIPQKVKPFTDRAADMTYAEAYRMLRANIQFSNKFSGGKTLCVTSGSVGEGKSLTAFNLAFVCAQLGDRVLLVDTDLHRPRQHKMVGVPNQRGVTTILTGEATVDDVVVKTKVPNLDFIPSGRHAAGVHGLMDSRSMKELILALRDRYQFIVFDAPPIIGVSDTSVLARLMDGVLLVIQHRKYPKMVARRARDMAENLGVNVVGIVLNSINIAKDYSYYYYQHYYYYRDKDKKGEPPAPAPAKT